MDFGQALEDLRDGQKVSRSGWNAMNQWVVLQPGYPDGIELNEATRTSTGLPQGTVRVFRPYLMLQAADESFTPWVPSQGDVLADDWYAVG